MHIKENKNSMFPLPTSYLSPWWHRSVSRETTKPMIPSVGINESEICEHPAFPAMWDSSPRGLSLSCPIQNIEKIYMIE
jgi:hypothetical protein